MKSIIQVVFLIFISISAFAQNYNVTGTIVDSSSRELLVGANIALESAYDSDKVWGGTSDLEGNFKFEVPAGAYRLRVSYVGYSEIKKRVFVSDKAVDMGKIELVSANMEDIIVEGRIPPAVLKGDTVEYNAAAFKTNPDATAEDLVEKMPGINITNGKVQAQGEDVKQVLVDGKAFFGDDAKATLKNLDAQAVDKVQVYDQQSDQSRFSGFDDGNTTKTINIVTKLEYRTGTFGRVYAGGGYDDEFKPGGEKYKAGGVINSFKGDRRLTFLGQFNNINEQNFANDDLAGVMSGGGGRGGRGGGRYGGSGNVGQFLVDDQGGITSTNAAGLNYSDKWGKKIDVSGSYFFNYTQNQNNSEFSREFFSARDSGQTYLENQLATSNNMNHRANFNFEYNISEKDNLRITPKFSFQMNDGTSDVIGETFKSSGLLNGTSTNFNSDVLAWTFSNRIFYNHRFEKKGRSMSVSVENDHKNQNAGSFLRATNQYYTISAFDTLDQNSNMNLFESKLSGRLEYNEPIGKTMQLQFRYEPSYSWNDADQQTFSYDSQMESYNSLDTALSNLSNNNFLAQEAGVGLRFSKGSVNAMVRAAFQYSELSVDQSFPTALDTKYKFYSFLPFAMLRYKISKTKNLRVFYRSNTNEPGISQLQEVLNNSNPIQLSIGNANLKQEVSHRLHTHYAAPNPEKNMMFFAMLMGTYTHNYIGNSNFIAYQDTMYQGVFLSRGTQLSRPVNAGTKYNLMGYTSIGLPLKALKSNLNFTLSAAYNETPGLINDELNYSKTPTGALGITLSSNISEKLDFTLSTNSSLSASFNTLSLSQNSQFLNQNTKLRFYWNPWKTIVFRTDLSHQYYNGLTDGFTTNYILWNASIATKLFKNKQGELALLVFDILDQNNSVSRTFTETYIENSQTNVLQRYLMLQFTYKFRPKKGDIPMDDEKEALERYQMHRNYRKH